MVSFQMVFISFTNLAKKLQGMDPFFDSSEVSSLSFDPMVHQCLKLTILGHLGIFMGDF